MPARAGTGWSVNWSSHTEHRDEIADEEELRASEHLGCYGAAIAHALGQAGAAPTQLKVTVETALTPDTETTSLVVEVRAQGPGLDQAVLEIVARRVEPACPVWKALAAEVSMRMVAVLEERQAVEATPPHTTPAPEPAPKPQTPPAMLASRHVRSQVAIGRPAWLTPKMGLAMAGMLVVGVRVLVMFGS